MVYNRNIRFRFEHAIKAYPIVSLCGARKTGKTTFAKQLAEQKMYNYVNFADIRKVIAAQDDPAGFINTCEKPVVFDEIQRVPELFLAIKQDVERHAMPGRYVMTSSIDVMQNRAFADVLAQHTHILPFYPLSQGELSHTFDAFIDTVFSQKSLIDMQCVSYMPNQLYKRIMVGGFPAIQDASTEQMYGWLNNYIISIIQNESARIVQIEGVSTIARLLFVLAKYTAQGLNIAHISRDADIPVSTLHRYLDMLGQLHICFNQLSFTQVARCAKSPKLFMADTGLLAWLLNVTQDVIYQNDQYMDQMIHNFVFNELHKQMSWNTTGVTLHHMRTVNGAMVDFVLQRSDGLLVGIVVKNNTHITPKDIKGLMHLKEHVGNKYHRGIILCPGAASLPMAHNISVLPISALWSFGKKS